MKTISDVRLLSVMDWKFDSNSSSYDYSNSHYEYIDEDDYDVVSKEEIDCHQQVFDWEQAKIRGIIEKRACPPFWDRFVCIY